MYEAVVGCMLEMWGPVALYCDALCDRGTEQPKSSKAVTLLLVSTEPVSALERMRPGGIDRFKIGFLGVQQSSNTGLIKFRSSSRRPTGRIRARS